MGHTRCVIFLFDGARFDVFADLLEAGKLPNISRHILADGTFLKGYSNLPTTTGPAHIPFLYGVYAGKAGVPGIRWFDKSRSRSILAGNSGIRSYVGTGCFSMGADIEDSYVPLYDYFSRPTNIFGHLDRNHHVKMKSNRLQKTWYYIRAHRTNEWEVVDYAAAQSSRKCVEGGVDFVFSLFPGIDEITHLSHPTHERVLRQYCRLDGLLGEVLHGLSDEEVRQILFFIVSDHGLTTTHTHVPLVGLSEEAGYTPVFYPRIRRRNYDIAIMESGNALASMYFMKPIAGRPALFKELGRVDKNRRFIGRLLHHEGIDFVAYRVDDSVLGISSQYGELVMDFNESGYVKLAASGENPLQFGLEESRVAVAETFNLTKSTNYPDSVVQVRQLFASNRTGDLVVFPKEGFDLRAKYEWPEHKSSHGSLLKAHMEVPICTNLKLESTTCRTVDVFPTILDDLGHSVPDNIDGQVIR
jgi:hypothetical protein